MSEPSAERIRLLSMVDIFEPLSEQEIERLNGQVPDVHLQPGHVLRSGGPDREAVHTPEGQDQDIQDEP